MQADEAMPLPGITRLALICGFLWFSQSVVFAPALFSGRSWRSVAPVSGTIFYTVVVVSGIVGGLPLMMAGWALHRRKPSAIEFAILAVKISIAFIVIGSAAFAVLLSNAIGDAAPQKVGVTLISLLPGAFAIALFGWALLSLRYYRSSASTIEAT